MSKVLFLTAGAAGMYCGSCMQDNALAKEMNRQGWDVVLAPCYTPIRVDGEDHSVDRVFFGGVNVYLQQKFPFFRWLPSFFDRWLSAPGLIRRLTAKASDTPPEFLGQMTVSMLKGVDGYQKKELLQLVQWAKEEVKPKYLVLSNLLIGGCIPELKRQLDVPVFVVLQGDDIFLDTLPEKHKTECLKRMAELSEHVQGFICHSEFYKNYMSDYLGIDAAKFHVVPLGFDSATLIPPEEKVEKPSDRLVVGYLARIAPEKGIDRLIDAFVSLHQDGDGVIDGKKVSLKVAGWLGDHRAKWFWTHWNKIKGAGLEDFAEVCGEVDLTEKAAFLDSIDLLCVPVQYPEPKGIYVLEGMSRGVPAVLPSVGAFPEMVSNKDLECGLLYQPSDDELSVDENLVQAIRQAAADKQRLSEMGLAAQEMVASKRSIQAMAKQMIQVLSK